MKQRKGCWKISVSFFFFLQSTSLIGSKYGALLILVILHLPATPFVPRQSCTTTLCSPLFLGMHVTSGEVVTSVECGRRIGRYLTDVIEADYMRLYPLPLTLPMLAAIGIEKWCMTVQSPSFPRLCGPRGRRTFHLLHPPDVPSISSRVYFSLFPVLRLLLCSTRSSLCKAREKFDEWKFPKSRNFLN